jgi:FlaA1/EpsC-like NDP-sugar epimerase
MGEQIRIVDLARDLITLAALKPDVDIAIDFIGLRPGEKMFEELLLDKEADQATSHDRIFIAQPDTFKIRTLNSHIKSLRSAAKHSDEQKIRQIIRSMVPGYRSGPSE